MNRSLYHILRKIAFFLLLDAVSFAFAAGLTYLLFSAELTVEAWYLLPAAIVCTVVIFVAFGLYLVPLRTTGVSEAVRIFVALVLSFATAILLTLIPGFRVSVRAVLMFYLIVTDLVLISRFSMRIWWLVRYHFGTGRAFTRVMIVGGGRAGAMIMREMQTSHKIHMRPVCIIDDDPKKWHARICDAPVVGGRTAISKAVLDYKVERIFITMPTAPAAAIREVCEICAETGCRVSILPGIYQLLDNTATMNQLRDVNIHDLLGREPVSINSEEVFGYIEGKVILVTGGGGSIGSELCRQIAAHHPKRLVIFDIYENNAYNIQMELARTHPDLALDVLIGSVRDAERVNCVFEAERPDIVFHAAAHKHVPLMETSPNEAVKNNVFGTLNVARAADTYGARRFVMISTDKAVNPTNVMGASKRICEMIVQTFARHLSHTEYVAVRFGNVLDSNGSVIPLFKKQIAAGGPVTVTHKDIIRYFMTIPEAVSLVLQAGAYAKGGEIFVLDMGAPMKILTLAENLIRLSGFRPYTEIPIEFIGLRPGEKLYEERLMDEEGLKSTANGLIHIGSPIHFDEDMLFATLDEMRAVMADDAADLLPLIARLVPTFHPNLAHTTEVKKGTENT